LDDWELTYCFECSLKQNRPSQGVLIFILSGAPEGVTMQVKLRTGLQPLAEFAFVKAGKSAVCSIAAMSTVPCAGLSISLAAGAGKRVVWASAAIFLLSETSAR
jgi:hypothetical protein